MVDFDKLEKICQQVRYNILTSTTEAKSGHPTTSLSAVELMVTLYFGGFLHLDLKDPKNPVSDRVVFSKGHASPLVYSLYHAAGVITQKELMTLRKIDSDLEGHPTFRFKYADVATGSLGQGLSAGVGMALGIKLIIEKESKIKNNLSSRIYHPSSVFVLLGDSEMTEGQVWEAVQIAGHYKLNNLIAIADINRLGQSTETMLGWDLKTYKKRFEAFGWNTIILEDGHDLKSVYQSLSNASHSSNKSNSPTIILAKTMKGRGVSFLENKEGWHGKPVPKDMLETALKELGEVDLKVRGKIEKPNVKIQITNIKSMANNKLQNPKYEIGSKIATRLAYGDALLALGEINEKIVALDAEMSNSTYSEKFAKKFPERYFEMFIAEQNMATTALGISKLGFIPFISTFAAFLTRGFDQLRMAQYSAPNLKVVGSHCGVSIGPDGPSQMGLEDISMFRSILESKIFYPADATSAYKLTQIMADTDGLFYLRTNRKETPVIYDEKEEFKIGGSKIHKIIRKGRVSHPVALIIAAGVTLHEALKAQKELANKGIKVAVLDVYCIKPLDVQSINRLTKEIKNVIVVEDHYPAGGIGEAVLTSLFNNDEFLINLISKKTPNLKSQKKSKLGIDHSLGKLDKLGIRNFIHLCVRRLPRSGTPEDLLRYEEIDTEAIIKAVENF